MFAIVAGIILAAVTVVLTSPLWRRAPEADGLPRAAGEDDDPWRADLEHDRETLLTSLSDLEMDLAQGRLTLPDYQRLKARDQRRLAAVLERIDGLARVPPQPPPHPAPSPPRGEGLLLNQFSATVISLLIVGSAVGIYAYNHTRPQGFADGSSDVRGAQPPGGAGQPRLNPPNPIEMVARLEARLRENPKDLQGQTMAGRSYMTLQRWEDAKKAWGVVLELDRRNHEAHFNLGWLLLKTRAGDDLRTFEEALARFDSALINIPRDPTVLWYRGVTLIHLKRYAEADANWTDAYQGLPPGSEEAKVVGEALTRLRAGADPLL